MKLVYERKLRTKPESDSMKRRRCCGDVGVDFDIKMRVN